jgi:hypothetical protein
MLTLPKFGSRDPPQRPGSENAFIFGFAQPPDKSLQHFYPIRIPVGKSREWPSWPTENFVAKQPGPNARYARLDLVNPRGPPCKP